METQVILFLLLLILDIVIYFLNKKNILSVSFLTCSIFLISSFFYMIDYGWYRHPLHGNTILRIILTIIFLFLGELLVGKIMSFEKPRPSTKGFGLYLSAFFIIVSFFFILVSGVIYFYDVYMFSLSHGNSAGDFFTMAEYVRASGEYSKSFIISQTTVIADCLLYLCFYCFVGNIIYNKKRKYRYIICFIPYLLHILANDSRTNVLKMICVFSIMIFILYKRKVNWSKVGNFKMVFIGLSSIILFVIIFRLLGIRTGVTEKYDLIHNVSKYVSSSLVGLDLFLNEGTETILTIERTTFAPYTFNRIYEFLNQFGFQIPTVAHHDVFFSFYGSTSNIYTGIKQYVLDFGNYGSYFVFFILGALGTFFFERLHNPKKGFVSFVMLGLFLYPFIMLPISNVITEFLNISTLYTFIYLIIFERILVHKKSRKGMYLHGTVRV